MTTCQQVDFVGIGAPKCGTSWIAQCLSEHPEIGLAAAKEVYFFADSEARTMADAGFDHYAKGARWYHAQMPEKRGAKAFGEYTVGYMYDPHACERMYRYRPDLKLLVTLRNPVDMVYSWYWYNRTGLIAKLPQTFREAIEIPFVRQLGLYRRALTPFYERFGDDRIHVVLHDDLRENSTRVLSELFAFLGVDDQFCPASLNRRVNAARATRFQWIQDFGGATYAALSRLPAVGRVVSSQAFEKVVLPVYRRINQVRLDYPPIEDDLRRQLCDYYADNIIETGELIGRDLAHWLHAPGSIPSRSAISVESAV